VLCWLVVALAGLVGQAATHDVEDIIKVEVTGTLQTGIVAIGGETTGTIITANEVTWELDLSRNPKLQRLAEKLNGRRVTVAGIYRRRSGVEIRQREIVEVTALRPAQAGP
jgi:hypothetical protein